MESHMDVQVVDETVGEQQPARIFKVVVDLLVVIVEEVKLFVRACRKDSVNRRAYLPFELFVTFFKQVDVKVGHNQMIVDH